MIDKVKKEVEELIKEYYLNCSITKFSDKVNWDLISIHQTPSPSEDFIREFQNKLDLRYISKYQILSEKIIREFQDKVDWIEISRHQTLSEDFIREFQDKVYWEYILRHQTLSEEFIKEFQDKGKIKVTKKTKSEILEGLKDQKKIAENLKLLGEYNSVNPRKDQLDYGEINWDR